MSNGILAGKILADIILHNDNKYFELFNPKRFNIGIVSGAIADGGYSALGYVNGILTDSDKIKYEVIDGKEIAIYEDETGKHIVYTKCPHMGCRLLFNEFEFTWDCPCHASRFDIDGKCISGPANENIGVNNK
jgi:nitrite reductase/ring-hydroxylating ferredoxin subunit